jgi:Transposase DDE domain group 1
VICRREDPHPGAQLTFSDAEGHRFQCCLTDSPDADIAFLEARQPGPCPGGGPHPGRQGHGLENLPFHDFASNNVWFVLVLIAQDLLAWTQQLLLDGELAVAEPKRLRYTLWHTVGRLVRTGRRTILPSMRLALG